MSDEQWRRPSPYGYNDPAGQVPWPPAPNWWDGYPQASTATAPIPELPQHPQHPQRGHRRLALGVVAATAALALGLGSVAVAFDGSHGSSPSATSFTPVQNTPNTTTPNTTTPNTTTPNSGSGTNPYSSGGFGSGGTGSGSTGTGTTGTGSATAAQQVGVVDINTVLNYGNEEAAGTGMVLTSSGRILTNNHVVDEATSISVTVVSTGKTYTATVVGTDPTDDVAVIQLSGASGLATAKLGDSSKVKVGDKVTGVGNAGGTGGVPSAAPGTVTALDQSLTASDESGGNSENLTGMIEVNANIQAGDSGGPLYAVNDTVIGMDTAASTGNQTTTTGYAIPIAKATSIASQIVAGKASSTIHIGYPAFLGVQVQGDTGGFSGFGSASTATGAAIGGVIDNTAAANAGIVAGDTITAVDGKTISSATDLTTAMQSYQPGDKVTIAWVDSSGQSHTATVTLGSGPAD